MSIDPRLSQKIPFPNKLTNLGVELLQDHHVLLLSITGRWARENARQSRHSLAFPFPTIGYMMPCLVTN